MTDLDGLEVPAYRLAEVELYERWHWPPSALEGMPISEREELRKFIKKIAATEKRSIPKTPPSLNPPGK